MTRRGIEPRPPGPLAKTLPTRPMSWYGWSFRPGTGDLGSIPGRVMPKAQKMVLDASMFNTQHYKVLIKGSGAIQGKEYHSFLHLSVVAIEREPSGRPRLQSPILLVVVFMPGFQF